MKLSQINKLKNKKRTQKLILGMMMSGLALTSLAFSTTVALAETQSSSPSNEVSSPSQQEEGPAVQAAESIDSWMPDKNLQLSVAKELNLADPSLITKAALSTVTTLDMAGCSIESIEGLEYATSLTHLGIEMNQISDLSPIANLTNLNEVNYSSNHVTDISVLNEQLEDNSFGNYQTFTETKATTNSDYVMEVPIEINSSSSTGSTYFTPQGDSNDGFRKVTFNGVEGNYLNSAGKLEFKNLVEGTNTIVIQWYGAENGTVPRAAGTPALFYFSGTYTLTLNYTKVSSSSVTAHYEDTEGNILSAEVTKNGTVGSDYTTEQKDIAGYTFKEVQGNPTGQFTDQAQTVTYVYTKNPVAGENVTATYVDTDGNKISDDVVKTGNLGDNYTTEQKEIAGYTFKEVQGNATGQFTDQAQTVTYVYTKVQEESSSTSNSQKEAPTSSSTYAETSTSLKKDSSGKSFPETGEYQTPVLLSTGISLACMSIYALKKKK